MIFLEKCFSCYILLTDQLSSSYCLYFLRYWATSVLQLFFSQVVKSNFEMKLIFLTKLFFYMTKNQGKNLNILWTKRAFKVKWKSFFIIFKRLSIANNWKNARLRIQWRLIFAIVIRCFRLRLWKVYFIYFKFTPVFF